MNLIAEVVRSKTLATQAELRDSRIKKTLKKLQQMRMTKKYLKKDIYLLKKRDNIFDNIDINIIYNSIIMEHQNIINLLDNKPSQPTKFRTKK